MNDGEKIISDIGKGVSNAGRAIKGAAKKVRGGITDLVVGKCSVCGAAPSDGSKIQKLVNRKYCRRHYGDARQRFDSMTTTTGDLREPYETINAVTVQTNSGGPEYVLSLLKLRAMDLGGDAIVHVQIQPRGNMLSLSRRAPVFAEESLVGMGTAVRTKRAAKVSTPTQKQMKKQITGRVVYNETEGGFWGIRAEDGARYCPEGLPSEFQKPGIGVVVELEELEGVSLRMWGVEVRILSMMVGQNAAGSFKDRMALSMITVAEAEGTLSPGCTIIEPSSGNTGIAMAMICRLRGYHLKIVLPENVSIERRQLLEVYGAEIIPSPGEEGSNGAVRRAQALADEHPEWVFLYQYGNEANPRAHYNTTGPEIWRDVPDITHFVAGLGTSGTLLGVGTYLKEQNPAVKVMAVEPPSGEQVEGLRSLDDGYIPPVFEKWGGYDLLDGKSIVRPRESLENTRLLADVGIFSGISAGAALAGARKVAERIDSGVIVFVVCDYGWKYLSTGAWTLDLDEAAANAEKVIYF